MGAAMITKNISAIILTNKNNDVLLQRKDNKVSWWFGLWSLISVEIKQNENKLETLIRKVYQETGINLDNAELFTINKYQNQGSQGKIFVYLAKYDVSISPILVGESEGFAFFSENETKILKIEVRDLAILNQFFQNK